MHGPALTLTICSENEPGLQRPAVGHTRRPDNDVNRAAARPRTQCPLRRNSRAVPADCRAAQYCHGRRRISSASLLTTGTREVLDRVFGSEVMERPDVQTMFERAAKYLFVIPLTRAGHPYSRVAHSFILFKVLSNRVKSVPPGHTRHESGKRHARAQGVRALAARPPQTWRSWRSSVRGRTAPSGRADGRRRSADVAPNDTCVSRIRLGVKR